MATLALITGILPLGALISALSQEVLNAAIAAQDVLVDQESFKILSRHLGDINGILSDFQRRKLGDSPAIRSALDDMRSRVIDAERVIKSAKGRSRFYLLMHSRSIVKNVQGATRGLGNALQMLCIAGAEVHMDIGENVHRLKERMVTAEFQATEAQANVMEKLQRGLEENKTDRGFANDLLRDIAVAVGVPTGDAELRSEVASFQRELEEVALRKEVQEKEFMEQVIAILYRAEAVSPQEDSESKYKRLAAKAEEADESYPPFPSFICPLTREVMVDPVILGTAYTYERSAIVRWLEAGNKTDPQIGEVLTSTDLRPNNSLRESIEEWAALNDIIKIRTVKEMFLSRQQQEQLDALRIVCALCDKNPEYKGWIGAQGVLGIIVDLLKDSSQELKEMKDLSLDALMLLVKDNQRNQEIFAEAGGLKPIIKFLNRNKYKAKSAVLLKELSKYATVCARIPEVLGAILSLVTVYFRNEKVPDFGENLKFVLDKLSDKDDNVIAMAKANWIDPLIQRLLTGSDAAKVRMANHIAITTMSSVCEENKTSIDNAVIPPLVSMCKSGRIEVKMAALGALSNLSSYSSMKSSVAAAGTISVVLELQVSLMYPLELRERAAAVLANLCSGNGIKYCVDANTGFLPLYEAVEPFFHFEGVSSSIMRVHILRALLGMAQVREARQLIQAGKGIPVLLSLMSGSDAQTRNITLRLLYYLSEDGEGALEISEELERRKAGLDLVRSLRENVEPDAQAAAAGILTNLPHGCQKLKNALLAAGVASALLTLVGSNDEEVQENAVGALRHFTEPSYLETQILLANLDIHPVLVQLLRTGSIRTKARAAHVLKNFSLSTPQLVSEPEHTGWMCFVRPHMSLCRVHKGKCTVRGSFCLVAAGAVGPLVSLLDLVDTEAAGAGVEALETLVSGSQVNHRGALVLHEMQGIEPLFRLLTHGSPKCTERAVQLLEHIFKVPRLLELYEASARMPLVTVSGLPNSTVTRKKVGRLLALMEVGISASH